MSNNRRKFFKLGSAAGLSAWAAPTVVALVLPSHAQASENGAATTTTTITTTTTAAPQLSIDTSDLRFCVNNFNNGNPITLANLASSTISLSLVGNVIVTPAGLGDLTSSNVSASVTLASGTVIQLAPPSFGTAAVDANGVAVITGNPAASFTQSPVAPFNDPTAGGAPSYPAVITIMGDANYGGLVVPYTASGTLNAVGSAVSFTLSSPDTLSC